MIWGRPVGRALKAVVGIVDGVLRRKGNARLFYFGAIKLSTGFRMVGMDKGEFCEGAVTQAQ